MSFAILLIIVSYPPSFIRVSYIVAKLRGCSALIHRGSKPYPCPSSGPISLDFEILASNNFLSYTDINSYLEVFAFD